MDPKDPIDEHARQRIDQLCAHGPKMETDHSIIPQLHDIDPGDLETTDLLQAMAKQVSMLAEKEVQLARTELKADIAKEMETAKMLGAAGLCALFGVNMLLVALALAISPVAASLIMGILLLVGAGVLGWLGWSERVQHPLNTTRKTLQEDVKWAKHRFT